MAELRGNHAIENAAVEWVMELEREAGREPQDTRYRVNLPFQPEILLLGKRRRSSSVVR